MTDTRSATKSLLGLPVPPPPLNGGGTSDPLVMAEEAEEGYALRAAREKEFVERVVPHSELLLAYARSRLKLEADAEDAVQDVMFEAWNAGVVAKCGGDDDRIQAYLLKSIRNRVANEFRRRHRKREFETRLTAFLRWRTNDAVPPWQRTVENEILEAIDSALQELPWIHREAYRLVHLLDVTSEVAAETLAKKKNTVRAYVTATCRHLRERLAAAGHAPNADGGRKEDTP